MTGYTGFGAIGRRVVLTGAAALPLCAIRTRPARAAEFTLKLANNVPASHPLSLRQSEAAARIREASAGRLDIQVFPSNQLGSDTDSLAQLRAGAIELFTLSGLILATFVPVASINGLGFAFKDYDDVWRAMDGPLGALVRREVDRRGLYAFDRIWDNGFRQITSSTRIIRAPDDLRGFKIRVPVSPLWTSMFEAFGAAPTSINLTEVYTSLQTKIVEGQENPLTLIQIAKFYEVQKSCSLTSHMWDGYWLLANKRIYMSLPEGLRDLMDQELNGAALQERADLATLSGTVQADLQAKGMQFVDVDKGLFRDTLKRAGFYATWRARYGEDAWAVLEGAVGSLS